jgi:hypothetical protein
MEPYNFSKGDALEASLAEGAGDFAYKFAPNEDGLEGDDGKNYLRSVSLSASDNI